MVEFRLYYDDNGDVLCYSCEKPIGKFIVIDAQTYAECRFDIKIINDKIVKVNDRKTSLKLVPSMIGVKCTSEDNAIIVNDSYTGSTINWNVKLYEFRQD